ncbi:hypothetical protein H1Z61_04465 [Bacillus aquiflavi]|uniref:Spore coat protein CotO n=1 Tax=Bacillus aquiflavi TaxID=2672567 RepID=A0A6B3VYH2_9BACI|nr:CotO family spore coat protein [Bacillus aquiflavi]MBA4536415.1 hypothetical protein [Bacillus aquiflavi]NEY80783.1 hypothetical protein [Bacillus aquiflavi]
MFKEKKEVKKPLLYIDQPTFKQPKLNMQETYSSKRAKKHDEENNNNKSVRKIKKRGGKGLRNQTSIRTLPVEEEIRVDQLENEEEVISTNKTSPFQRVKSFKEMGLEERVQYLANFPKQLPSVPCLFKTKERTYKGFLVQYDDKKTVTIKLYDKTEATIAVSELLEVKMIGYK